MAPLYLGSATSDAFYMGGNAVQRIYLGGTEVWAPGGGGSFSLLYGPHQGSGGSKAAPHLGPNSNFILSLNLSAKQEPYVSVRDTSPANIPFQYIRRLDATNSTFSSSSILSWDDTQPTFGSAVYFNQNFYQFRQFALQGNGSASAIEDTSGTITSYHMCNPGIGWNITTYTGNGVANSTIGHGCGQEPDLIMVWRTNSTSSGSTKIYHRGLGKSGFWGSNGSWVTSTSDFNTFTTSTMQTGSFVSQNYNTNGAQYAMLCFYNVAGKVAVGTLNEAGSGTHSLNLGFTPKVFHSKTPDASFDYDWRFREAGGTGNTDRYQWAGVNDYQTNESTAVFTATGIDLAAGQKGNDGTNQIIYLAIAE